MSRPARRVLPTDLRKIFNDGRYHERVLANELLAVVEREGPAAPGANQEPGTVSRTVWYFDLQMQRVALVHEYRKPDGSLGGSGRPDPKRILLDDEILFC